MKGIQSDIPWSYLPAYLPTQGPTVLPITGSNIKNVHLMEPNYNQLNWFSSGLVPFIGSGVLSEPHCRDLTALMSHVGFS